VDTQAKIQTWKADFVQTRSLKSLTHPLSAPGHVWFKAPNLFRWELGIPPRTIAVRSPKELQLIYPLPKRVERYPLTEEHTGQWRDALALLETGFPRSHSEVEARFQTVSEQVTNGFLQVVLEPKSADARKFIPRFQLEFTTNGFSLHASQLFFPDGSYLRNDFTNAVVNPELDAAVFSPTTPPDFIVTEPLTRKGQPPMKRQ
jgi:outer membrane lipoprotein-sorting protein